LRFSEEELYSSNMKESTHTTGIMDAIYVEKVSQRRIKSQQSPEERNTDKSGTDPIRQ